jgi:hypothetical protein
MSVAVGLGRLRGTPQSSTESRVKDIRVQSMTQDDPAGVQSTTAPQMAQNSCFISFPTIRIRYLKEGQC